MFARSLFITAACAAVLLTGCGSSGGGNPPSSTAGGVTGKNHVHSIIVEPASAKTLFVGTHYRLIRSTDGGRNWKTVLKQMFLSLAMDPKHPSTIYGVSQQNGPVKSDDNGGHWRKLSVPGISGGHFTGVSVDASTGTIFLSGTVIARSTDGGAHWSVVLRVPSRSVTSVAAGTGSSVYAASGDGLFLSRDAGVHWQSVKAVGNQPVIQVAAAGMVAYAAGAIGDLYRTSDGGASWKRLSHAPQGIEFMGIAPSDPNEVIAEIAQQGFKMTRDGGVTWQRANNGIRDRDFNASTVRVAPSNPNVAYTGAWGLHFYATHDGGRHWVETASLKR